MSMGEATSMSVSLSTYVGGTLVAYRQDVKREGFAVPNSVKSDLLSYMYIRKISNSMGK